MKVIFVITEATPFLKLGGLGEVGGSLPAALQRLGVDVRVIMPKYKGIPDYFRQKLQLISEFKVPVGWRSQDCGLQAMTHQGIKYYFIDNDYYFSRQSIYDEFDKAEQFAFFSRAVLEALLHIPECKPDIVHCHDWPTALIPLMLKAFYQRDPLYYRLKTVFTIHNMEYQGIFPEEVLYDVLGLDKSYYTEDTLKVEGGINYMKAALIHADQITTVSPTYAREIQTAYFGRGLEGWVQKRSESLKGILNGLDYDLYNPAQDPLLKVPYGDSTQPKLDNKLYLQSLLNLPIRGDVPLLGMVTRLTEQKGIDLLAHILEEIMDLDVQLVILGAGNMYYENRLHCLAEKYPEKLAVRTTYSDELAHKIFAGADLFIMPSRFEPCGMSQMMAMHYGAVPVVRNTGGLSDTVISYDNDAERGNGFSFGNYNAHELLYVIQRAIKLFREDQQAWKRIQDNAMHSDFSWEHSAQEYIKIYRSLVEIA
ncbi:MAG: glycogen synthase GlgA [Desulfitobacterium hafniense]|nr:glycogen synthase GlgA [Desulfitobacterium hafniense]